MKKLLMSLSAVGVIALSVWSLSGTVPASQAASAVNFIATDEPGPWFQCVGATGCVPAGTQSLAVIQPGDTVRITNGAQTNSVHTFTSLLFPTGARGMPFDQDAAFRGTKSVKLKDPGLYVFVCKLHPFMLAATIVDDPRTAGLDLGENISLINGITVPTSSDLATRLLRAFFLITNPANYQDRNPATNPSLTWHIAYPSGVPVRITGGAVVDLKDTLEGKLAMVTTSPWMGHPGPPTRASARSG